MKKALKSNLEDVVLAMLKTPAEFDADELRYSMKVCLFFKAWVDIKLKRGERERNLFLSLKQACLTLKLPRLNTLDLKRHWNE